MFFFKPGANLLSAMAGCFVFAAVFDSATAREGERERVCERERTELNLERERMSQFWCWQ